MSIKKLGIDLARACSTTQLHELGMEVTDPRGGEQDLTYTQYLNGVGTAITVRKKFAPNACYRYVKFLGTVTAGDACRKDVTATAAIRDATAIRTSAADQVLEGIAVLSAISGQFGWLQFKGRFYDANVADASAAGDVLGSTSTAGRLGTPTPSATNALAAAASRCGAPQAVIDGTSGNLADIDLPG